jgi:hypothetical protein
VFPSHLDGGFHVVCENDKLGWSAVIMRAKADDVHLSHSGRENSGKTGAEQGGAFYEGPCSRSAFAFLLDGISKAPTKL